MENLVKQKVNIDSNDNAIKTYDRNEIFKSTLNYFGGDELATNTWINKYALKDSYGNLYELNPNDTHRRLSKEIARIEQNYPNPMSEDTIYSLLENFKYLVPGGGSLTGIGNNNQVSSLSNCFVIGNQYDSYGSVFHTDEQQVQLMKRRGGVGHDLSHIRPAGSPVKNSALTSTGIVPFMERYSNSTREVAQESRRGALMLSILVNHPEAENFINAKLEDGKITGANISVKITDDFMNSVINDKPFIQQFPVNSDNPTITKEIDGKKLWNKIIHNVWKKAEPGVLFWDKILSESPADCYGSDGFTTVSTNPCFAGEMKLLTSEGYKTFKELSEANNGFHKLTSFKNGIKIGSVWCSGIKHIIEVTLDNGVIIKCTKNHLFRTISDDDIRNELLFKRINDVDIKAENLFGKTLRRSYAILENESINNPTVIKIEDKGEVVEVFDFNIQDDDHYGTVEGVVVHNCGEIPLCPYDSCRLLSLNLYSYVDNPYTKDARFNVKLFKEHAQYALRIMDDIVDLEIEKIEGIISKIKSDPEPSEIKETELSLWENVKVITIKGRRTGLGITSEGDMLAAMGYRYGSEEGIEFSVEVQRMLATQSYISSINLAEERGCFQVFDIEKEKNNPFIKRVVLENSDMDSEFLLKYYKTGRRNISCLTIAPTGSISLMTQTSSGIEPAFGIKYTRKRKINPNDKGINLETVTYDVQGDAFEKYNVYHHGFITWAKINNYDLRDLSDENYEKLYQMSPYYKSTSADIDWLSKVRMQGEIQKWVDHSISVTVNIPEDTSEEMVSDIYMTAWKSGCKGITIYREGSRDGIMVSDKHQQKTDGVFKEFDVPKRPKIIECDVIHFSNKGEKWVGVLGLVKDRPIEIFTGKWDSFMIPALIEKGFVIKVKENGNTRYDFQYVDADGYKCTMEGLNRAFNREYHNYARLISGVLRQGMPLIYVYELIDGLKLEDGDSITDWKSGVKRLIKKHIKEGVKTKDLCPDCGANLIFSENCKKCTVCGYSACG